MLRNQCSVWISFKHKSLEQAPVQVVTFTLLHCQRIVVDLRPELPDNHYSKRLSRQIHVLVISNQNELFGLVGKRSENMALQNLARFLYKQDTGLSGSNVPVSL